MEAQDLLKSLAAGRLLYDPAAVRRGAEETMSAVRRRRADPTVGAAFDGYTEAVGVLEHEAARDAVDELEGGG